MKIGARTIGPAPCLGAGNPPYIIAELGVNHDGSVARALELVDAAADAGADAVKLQLFRAGMLMSRASRLANYQQDAGERDPLSMLARLELGIDQMGAVVERAHARGVHAILTVFSVPLVPEAEQLPWDAYKTASPDIIHLPLLEALMETGRPLIVSTGASTMEEVVRAMNWLAPACERVAVLQCVSSYPTLEELASLDGITALMEHLNAPVGYSDHTAGIGAGAQAVSFGACILEKHLTLDRRAAGPDHAASLEPGDFRAYAAAARAAKPSSKQAPSSHKRVLECEEDVRRVSRQSICSARPIAAGETIGSGDVCFKRPGTGIEPFRLAEVVGRRAARAIEADVPLTGEDLA